MSTLASSSCTTATLLTRPTASRSCRPPGPTSSTTSAPSHTSRCVKRPFRRGTHRHRSAHRRPRLRTVGRAWVTRGLHRCKPRRVALAVRRRFARRLGALQRSRIARRRTLRAGVV
eukprot:6026167-Prymnesium_polylepis.2